MLVLWKEFLLEIADVMYGVVLQGPGAMILPAGMMSEGGWGNPFPLLFGGVRDEQRRPKESSDEPMVWEITFRSDCEEAL